jgi:hypothetical protein
LFCQVFESPELSSTTNQAFFFGPLQSEDPGISKTSAGSQRDPAEKSMLEMERGERPL